MEPNIEELTISESEKFRIKGNEAYKEKNYEEAIKYYSQGLKIEPQDLNLLSNRSLCYLNLTLFSLALSDAESALKIQPSHTKSIYRKSRALIGQHKYYEAASFVDENIEFLNIKGSDNESLGSELSKLANKYLEEEQLGQFDIPQLLREQSWEHDVADYNVPIGMEIFERRGRGVVVKENVKRGDLLVVNKAFAFSIFRKNKPISETEESSKENEVKSPAEYAPVRVDYHIERKETKNDLVAKIVDKIKTLTRDGDSNQLSVFYNLFSGPKLGNLELGQFPPQDIDIDRISGIFDSNALHSDGRWTFEYKELLSGLWLFPSYINHSCYDVNCTWKMIGDILIIRALSDIKAGQELIYSYVSILETYEKRDKILKSYGIKNCACRLCELQKNDTEEDSETRSKILENYENLLVKPGALITTDTEELDKIVEKLESLHYCGEKKSKNSASCCCFFLLEPYRTQAKRYFKKNEFKKSIEILEKGYKIVQRTQLGDFVITFVTNIISAFLKDRNKKEAIRWTEILRDEIKVYYGEPFEEILKTIGPDTISKLKKEKIIT